MSGEYRNRETAGRVGLQEEHADDAQIGTFDRRVTDETRVRGTYGKSTIK